MSVTPVFKPSDLMDAIKTIYNNVNIGESVDSAVLESLNSTHSHIGITPNRIVTYLLNNGWSLAATIGVAANTQAECSCKYWNIGIDTNSKRGGGMVAWNDNKFDALINYCKSIAGYPHKANGDVDANLTNDENNLSKQCDFLTKYCTDSSVVNENIVRFCNDRVDKYRSKFGLSAVLKDSSDITYVNNLIESGHVSSPDPFIDHICEYLNNTTTFNGKRFFAALNLYPPTRLGCVKAAEFFCRILENPGGPCRASFRRGSIAALMFDAINPKNKQRTISKDLDEVGRSIDYDDDICKKNTF